jgi:hypothetical protein
MPGQHLGAHETWQGDPMLARKQQAQAGVKEKKKKRKRGQRK